MRRQSHMAYVHFCPLRHVCSHWHVDVSAATNRAEIAMGPCQVKWQAYLMCAAMRLWHASACCFVTDDSLILYVSSADTWMHDLLRKRTSFLSFPCNFGRLTCWHFAQDSPASLDASSFDLAMISRLRAVMQAFPVGLLFSRWARNFR